MKDSDRIISLEQLLRRVIDECTANVGSDDPQFYPPGILLLSDIVAALHKTPEPCRHDHTMPGPRMVLRYGSATTEICKRCGWYREAAGRSIKPGPWKPGPVPMVRPELD